MALELLVICFLFLRNVAEFFAFRSVKQVFFAVYSAIRLTVQYETHQKLFVRKVKKESLPILKFDPQRNRTQLYRLNIPRSIK